MSDVVEKQPLTEDYLKKMDAYWRAANYLGAAQLYLLDNPLLREPLTRDQVKKKIVGHWGTVPGQNFVYVHLNRVIKKYDQDMILISGPGHGGNFFVANTYLEGTYSEVYPNIGEDMDGLKKLCKQFSFPGGISSHVAPETPGSINEAGELVKPEEPNGYKFETLVLDMVHMQDSCLAFEVDRSKEFAPVKNAVGVDSVETARALLEQNGVVL